jgi:hypothetical protein
VVNTNRNRFKGARVRNSFMFKHYDIDVFEMKEVDAKSHPQKKRYLQQKADAQTQDWRREFGAAIWANTAQDRGSIGGFRWWLKTTGYIGIAGYRFNLATAANASLRAQENAAAGNPDRDRFRPLITAAQKKGGNIRAAFMDDLSYDFFYADLEAASMLVKKDSAWMGWKGRWAEYYDCVFALDADAPAGYCVGIDPDTWNVGIDKSGINATDYKRLDTKKALWRSMHDSMAVLICVNPQCNFISSGHTYV